MRTPVAAVWWGGYVEQRFHAESTVVERPRPRASAIKVRTIVQDRDRSQTIGTSDRALPHSCFPIDRDRRRSISRRLRTQCQCILYTILYYIIVSVWQQLASCPLAIFVQVSKPHLQTNYSRSRLVKLEGKCSPELCGSYRSL